MSDLSKIQVGDIVTYRTGPHPDSFYDGLIIQDVGDNYVIFFVLSGKCLTDNIPKKAIIEKVDRATYFKSVQKRMNQEEILKNQGNPAFDWMIMLSVLLSEQYIDLVRGQPEGFEKALTDIGLRR